MFVYFSGLTSVPSNIPFDTRMVDLQNNKIKEIKENDFRGLTSLYVRLYALIFKYLVKILITVGMITYIASVLRKLIFLWMTHCKILVFSQVNTIA